MKSILNNDFSHVPTKIIQQALVEFYSKRSPELITVHIPTLVVNIPITIKEQPFQKSRESVIVFQKKDIKDCGTQTYDKKDKYKYIFEITDKRKRRSAAWKIYKTLCDLKQVEPELRYPQGDDHDYIKLTEKLEKTDI